MSLISVQGEKSTSAEIAKLTELTNLGDPNADVILFWDDSAGQIQHLSIGSGLSISGTTLSASGSGGFNFSDSETPSGSVNGLNSTFVLAHTPSPATSLIFVVNGQVLAPSGVDMTLSGTTVTTITAPPTNSVVLAWYRY
mgnify:CR=1 FL=1